MLRTKVVQGVLSADQAEVMASITDDFARGIIDCTTRQCFQNHWLTLDEVPEVFSRLEKVGLTTSGACGDITRNVIGCTLAGIGHEQVADGHATARGDPRVLPRQQALLEPPAQVQDLRHGLQGGLRARPHQRRLAVGRDPRGRHRRLQHPRRRRALERAALLALDRRLRRAGGGARGGRRDHRDLPRLRREPRQARPRAAEVPGRPDRARRPARAARRAARARRPARRPRRPRPPRPRPHRRDAADRRRALRGRLLRAGRAPARRPAARARPARPRVRDRPRGPAHAPAERAAAVDPQRAGGRAAGRAARAGALARSPSCSRAGCRPAPARSSAGWPRSTPRTARPRSRSSSTRT